MTKPHKVLISRRKFMKRAVAGGAALAGTLVTPKAGQLFAPALAQGFDEVPLQLNWIKSVQHSGHFAAIEKGFFREERLNVEVLGGGPGIDSIALVANGRAMMGDRDSSNVVLARARGVPIKGFAATFQRSPFCLMSLKEKPVRSLRDMVGKTIALHPGRRPTIVALLRRANIDPNSVNFVPATGDASILVSGQVAGYFGWSTNEGVAMKMKGIDLDMVNVGDLGDPTYPQVLFATDETLRTKVDVLARWLRAAKKGWKYYAEHPEEVARFTVEKYAQKGMDLNQQTAEAKEYPPFILGGDAEKKGVLWIDFPNFSAGLKLAKEANLLKQDVPVESLVDQKPLIAAARSA